MQSQALICEWQHWFTAITHWLIEDRKVRSYWKSALTQASVAEVLSQADVTQLAGCDLSNLKSHSRALTHRLHPDTHRLHLQHQHRHLQVQQHADVDDVRAARSDWFPLTAESPLEILPCLLQGRLCSETRRWPCPETSLPPAPVQWRPRWCSRHRFARWWHPWSLRWTRRLCRGKTHKAKKFLNRSIKFWPAG